jgi:hypothetical protein
MLPFSIFESKRWLMMLMEEIVVQLILVTSQNHFVSNLDTAMKVKVVEGVPKDMKLLFQITSFCPFHISCICE